jgi:hypothetical protein
MYKTELERLTDPEYGKRKLDHYNAWLLDPTRDPSSRYGGFPEDIERERGFREMQREYQDRGTLAPRKPAKPAKPPKVKAERKPRPGGPTKAQKAEELYRNNMNLSKVNLIALFQEELQMSQAGATTYYYNVMKRV